MRPLALITARCFLAAGVVLWAGGLALAALGGGLLPWLLGWVGVGSIFMAWFVTRAEDPEPDQPHDVAPSAPEAR